MEQPQERAGWIVAAVLFALLTAGATLEFTRDRRQAAPRGAPTESIPAALATAFTTPILPDPGVAVPLQPERPIWLPVDRGSAYSVASDDERPTSNLWAISSTTTTTTVRRLLPTASRAFRLRSARPRPDAVDVAAWIRGKRAHAFLINAETDGQLRIDIHELVENGGRVRRYSARGPRRQRRAQRTLQVGHWSGPRADLFVLDRARTDNTMHVRILSGESGFQSTVLSVSVPEQTGFDRRGWTVDSQDITNSGRSDLVFSTRGSTNSGSTEVHVLAAQTNYSRFLMQVRAQHPARRSARWQAVTLLQDGQPKWTLVDPQSGTAVPHLLMAVPRRTAQR